MRTFKASSSQKSLFFFLSKAYLLVYESCLEDEPFHYKAFFTLN
jgi:hypothetical protein